jgi:hypothetical protein
VNPNEEQNFKDVINTLEQLQQVKAPAGFEADLMRRINSEKFREEKTFWQNILIPSRLIPAAALAITAILLIFVLNDASVTQDNPLLAAPRERSDLTQQVKPGNSLKQEKSSVSDEVLSSKEISGIRKDKDVQNKPLEKSPGKQKSVGTSSGGNIAGNVYENDKFITAKFSANGINNYPVNKAGLNFRQVNLSNQQKTEVNKLKEKMDEMFNSRAKH